MIYEYECSKCQLIFDVAKSHLEMESPEVCLDCKGEARRNFPVKNHSKIQFLYTKVQESEYNPGLGQIVKSRQHRQELCKQMGLIEVGNNNPDTIAKDFEKQRADKWRQSWDSV